MKRLQETHGNVFELIRHFLARMFDSELFSTQGQWRTVAIGAFAMLLPAGLLLFGNNDQFGSLAHPENAFRLRHLARLATAEPFRTAVLANELAMLTAVFAITGLIGLLEWQSLYPSRRDYLALAGLPIRSRQIFAARFAAVLLFSTGTVATVNLLPTLIVPLQLSSHWQQNPSYIANVAAQAASSGLACFFVLFSMIALQGVLLNVLPGKVFARVSAYVQGALVAALGLAFLYTWFIKDWGNEALATPGSHPAFPGANAGAQPAAPFDAAGIRWRGGRHPAEQLPSSGLRADPVARVARGAGIRRALLAAGFVRDHPARIPPHPFRAGRIAGQLDLPDRGESRPCGVDGGGGAVHPHLRDRAHLPAVVTRGHCGIGLAAGVAHHRAPVVGIAFDV